MSLFISLPHEILVNIFQHLPFKDRIRLGLVSPAFRRASIDSIDHTEVLEVSDDLLEYCLASRPYYSLLESCSTTLRSIKINSPTVNPILLRYLPEMTFPNLTDLEFATAVLVKVWNTGPQRRPNATDGESDRWRRYLFDLIRRNRANLRSMVINVRGEFVFPPDMSNDQDLRLDNLHRLTIRADLSARLAIGTVCNHLFHPLIRSMSGLMPNLKYLKIRTATSDDEWMKGYGFVMQRIDSFWPTVPNLLELELIVHSFPGVLDKCRKFWKISSLRSLKIDVLDACDGRYLDLCGSIIKRIVDSFPNLERFASKSFFDFDGIMELSRLHNLRELRLDDCNFNGAGFKSITTAFASLTYLEIHSIHDAQTTTDLINILMSIPHLGRRKLAVRFCDEAFRQIWDSDVVRAVLEQIKTDRGVEIEFLA